MFDNSRELLEKIQLREDTYLEVKEVRFAGPRVSAPRRDSIADTITAFANTRGGVLVLGVDDKTYGIIGIPLERIEKVTDFVREVCIDKIEPPLESFFVEHLLMPSDAGEQCAVVKVDVPRSLFIHRSPGGYMYRVGNGNRVMSSDYLARMFQQRSQSRLIRFDEMPVRTALLSELDPSRIEQFRVEGSYDNLETMAGKLGMAVKQEDERFCPTVTGILLGAEQPTQWIPHAYIQAVAYRGSSVPESLDSEWYQLDARDITGSLDCQVADACLFVTRNQKVRAKKVTGRMDQPQYDVTSVFEAIVNAVAHRDYSMYGSRIRLHMFSDRIELYSPGALANSMTVDDLAYRQASRNETLTSLITRCPLPTGIPSLDTPRTSLMDRRGNGVPIILARSERLSGRRPVYEMLGDAELRLTIYAAGPNDED